jgi:mycobactin polyketide synthetase MbtD
LIVHAAGSAGFGDSTVLTGAAFADAVAAKVGGLAHLAELWPVRAKARTLLCSSLSGLWGGRGHAAYSAANRLLDVMAAELRAAGRHCVAVRWGLWQPSTGGESGRGIVDTAEIENIERSGLRPMTPRDAIEASLRDWPDDPLVFAADTARLRIFLGGGRSEARCRATEVGPPPADGPVPVVDAVRSQLAALLGIEPPSELNLGDSLFDLGVDSMLALDLRKRLNRTIGRTVSLATLMGEITGAELVEQLEGADERSDRAQKVDVSRD